MKQEIDNDHDPDNVLRQLKSQGAKVAWVHPCRTFLLPRPGKKTKLFPPRAFLDQLDYFEVFNAQTRPSENRRAAELAREHRLTPIRGLDAHFYFELKRPPRGYSLAGYLGSFFAKHWKRLFA
jgi:predicted metal-dependent phosphoesterase TrpH